MKSIIEAIITLLFCAVFTAIIIVLVVIPSPTDITSYVLLSFILLVDGLVIYLIFPFRLPHKDKPKTVSKRLIFWLLVVLYCCLCSVGLLTNAYFLTDLKALVLSFDCIFAALGLAALVALAWQFVAFLAIKYCLKYGKEQTAEFVGCGKSLTFEYGKPQTASYHSVFRYGVVFKYCDGGKEITKNSRRVYTLEEVELLQKMATFSVRYTKRTAVINEILKPTPQNGNGQTD